MKQSGRIGLGVVVGLAGGLLVSAVAHAGAIRQPAGYDANVFGPNDDGSRAVSDIGFELNFFGVQQSNLWINNNGNVTFDGPMSSFTPFDLQSTGEAIIAPFFADVDTRNSSPVTFGTAQVGGQSAFFVNWENVGHYFGNGQNRNSFQLVIVDRSDTGAGNFDFEFNYDRVVWEAGEASGGDANGRGGAAARMGWSNGMSGEFGASYEHDGSAVAGSFLDDSASGLIWNSLNSDVAGRYVFSVRNGEIVDPAVIPLPSASMLGLAGLAGVAVRRRR